MAQLHFLIGITNTIFALCIAIAFLYCAWALTFYVWEMGSEEGKREYKGMLMNGTSAFALLIIVYTILASLLPIEASAATSATVLNPLAVTSFCGLMVDLYKGVLALGVSVGVLFIVYSGFLFVLAQGNEQKITDARKAITNTVIGIGIFLAAMLIAQVVANTVNQVMNGAGTPDIMSCQ